MKRIVVTVMVVLMLTVALGGAALAEGPSDAAYNAPAKGHQGVPGNGIGHELARGRGHLIHGGGTANPAGGPSDAAYNAPAKGHQGVPGKGIGHELARGRGHLIHGGGTADEAGD
jgi:hypothetical protein